MLINETRIRDARDLYFHSRCRIVVDRMFLFEGGGEGRRITSTTFHVAIVPFDGEFHSRNIHFDTDSLLGFCRQEGFIDHRNTRAVWPASNRRWCAQAWRARPWIYVYGSGRKVCSIVKASGRGIIARIKNNLYGRRSKKSPSLTLQTVFVFVTVLPPRSFSRIINE